MQQASALLFCNATWSKCLHLVRLKFWHALEVLVYSAACAWVVDYGTDAAQTCGVRGHSSMSVE